MKRALIQLPSRVAEVIDPVARDQFPVAAPLFWVSCPDDATPETHFFDGTGVAVKPPPPVVTPDPRLVQDAAELAEAKADQALLNLVDATSTQLQAWAQNNFPSLSPAEQNRMALILYGLAAALRPHIR